MHRSKNLNRRNVAVLFENISYTVQFTDTPTKGGWLEFLVAGTRTVCDRVLTGLSPTDLLITDFYDISSTHLVERV